MNYEEIKEKFNTLNKEKSELIKEYISNNEFSHLIGKTVMFEKSYYKDKYFYRGIKYNDDYGFEHIFSKFKKDGTPSSQICSTTITYSEIKEA